MAILCSGEQTHAGSQARAGLPYKVYTALLTQTGTDDPVAIELQNTTETTFTWSRDDVGVYSLSADAGTPFTVDKTAVITGLLRDDGSNKPAIAFADLTTSHMTIRLRSHAGDPTDDLLISTFLEVRIYP